MAPNSYCFVPLLFDFDVFEKHMFIYIPSVSGHDITCISFFPCVCVYV